MAARSQNPVSIGAALGSQDLVNEQQGLLDLIDKLQFAQLDNIKLPQIVVVGDQSAGKSSVLEAVTSIPFPRDAGACTRFATEIRLRRANEEKFTIRIIPDKTRTFAEQGSLRQWGATVDESTDFRTLMRSAVDKIAPKNVPGRFATGDILVVEKSGPDRPMLTVVDLPGLVGVPNNEQSADDIKAINHLTDLYMKSSRTIILAVVGGNQDYVQAPVLIKARNFDPTGERTIGVLTKPDLIESIGLEDKFIGLVNNEDRHNRFVLGWYVLLNPGPRDSGQESQSAGERKRVEDEFFSRGKWGGLPPTRCGAAMLKQKLSLQLQRHIGKHVRTLQKEVQKAHDDCEAELRLLGSGKDTAEEMKDELVELFSRSKDLVNPAVDGTYTNRLEEPFFPSGVDGKAIPPQNLRARAVEENRRFAERVRVQGQTLEFLSELDAQTGRKNRLGGRVLNKNDFARKVVEPLLRQNTGTEFPTDNNPRLVYKLFQRASENWSRLAQEHKNKLAMICTEFLGEVIDHIWPRRMHDPLRTEHLDPQVKETMRRAQEQVELLRTDLKFEVQPYDPEYEERLKSWYAQAAKEGSSYTKAEELLEKMLIHYELSAKTFISNVITQVVERHLLQGLHAIFSGVKVHKMDERTILAIAAENQATRDKRIELKAKKVAIEAALDICTGLAMRKELRTYSQIEPDSAEDSSDDGGQPSKTQRHSKRQMSSSYSTGSTSVRYPREEQQPQSRWDNQATNGNYGHSHTASVLGTSPVSGRHQSTTSSAQDPTSSPGGVGRESKNYDQTTIDPPNHPPPAAPPRPGKVAQLPLNGDYPPYSPVSPPSPPDSSAPRAQEAASLFAQQQRQRQHDYDPFQLRSNGVQTQQQSAGHSQSSYLGTYPASPNTLNGYGQPSSSPVTTKVPRKHLETKH